MLYGDSPTDLVRLYLFGAPRRQESNS